MPRFSDTQHIPDQGSTHVEPVHSDQTCVRPMMTRSRTQSSNLPKSNIRELHITRGARITSTRTKYKLSFTHRYHCGKLLSSPASHPIGLNTFPASYSRPATPCGATWTTTPRSAACPTPFASRRPRAPSGAPPCKD